jgi:cysteine synthase
VTRFANILETVGNTPVVRINKLAPAHVDLYVKVEAFNPLGSVKDRLALGVIEDAERSGALKPVRPSSKRRAATPASGSRWCARRRATRWS